MTTLRILITGANSGLGLETARRLFNYKNNLHILLACRTKTKAMEAATTATNHYEDVVEYACAPNIKFNDLTPNNMVSDFHTVGTESSRYNNTTVLHPVLKPLEMTDFSSIRSFVRHIDKEHGPIDILVNCAGVFLSENTYNTTIINAAAPTLLTSLLKPRLRTVSIITSPQAQAGISYPSSTNLIDTKRNALMNYIHTKQMFACTMTHLASQNIGGQHILLGPGAIDTGIHGKLSSNTSLWTRFALNIQYYFFYHGSIEWASDIIASAVVGKFDNETNTEKSSTEKNMVQIVDLGERLDLELCGNTATNQELYESLIALPSPTSYVAKDWVSQNDKNMKSENEAFDARMDYLHPKVDDSKHSKD